MKKWLAEWRLLLPVPITIILLCGLTPVSEALWSDELRISGSIETGSWGCTLTVGYWSNHPNKWPIDELSLGDVIYTKWEARKILRRPPRGDATYVLAQQLIGAKLNTANGASSIEIADTLASADAFLIESPVGSNPANPAHDEGTALADQLAAYNEGRLWPRHCDCFESPFEEIQYETATEEPIETQEPPEVTTEEPTETQEPTAGLTQEPTQTQDPTQDPTQEPTEQSTPEAVQTEGPTQEPVETQKPAE